MWVSQSRGSSLITMAEGSFTVASQRLLVFQRADGRLAAYSAYGGGVLVREIPKHITPKWRFFLIFFEFQAVFR